MGGNTGDIKRYATLDVRSATSARVIGSRRFKPVGACIHNTDGSNSLAWLQGSSANAGRPASADCLVSKSGQRYLLTGPSNYAYHAGTTATVGGPFLIGPDMANHYLLGIELEYRSLEGPTFEQVDSCAEQLIDWAIYWGWRWPLVIFGHYGLAVPIGRRSDPFLLDWGSLMGRLYLRAQTANLAGLVP